MWPISPSLAAICLAVGMATASGATWFGFASPRIEAAEQRARADVATLQAEYQKGRAEGEAAGRTAQQDQQDKAQEANDARIQEYAAIADRADKRTAAALRVCPPGARASAVPGDRPPGSPARDSVPAGPLADPDGSDPGAVLAADLRRYANDAERMSADLRAVTSSCEK